MSVSKVSVVGSGSVGATTAMRVAQRGLADVVMVDIVEGLPQGLALDMAQSAPIERFESRVWGGHDFSETADSDVVVITAGFPRKPGMSRADLLEGNAQIVRSAVEQIVQWSAGAIIIVVTNPLDEMTFLAAQVSQFPRERVMGMAGVLDSSRLCVFIGEELGVSPLDVEAMTLGSHGENMIPLSRTATVGGRPLTELVDAASLERLYDRTRGAGAEIVASLKRGSAYYAPSAAVAKMVNAIVADTKEVMPVSAWCIGEYGVVDAFVGVPVRLGRGGIEEIIEIDLLPGELEQLRHAALVIKQRCSQVNPRPA